MAESFGIVLTVLGLMAGSVIAALWKGRKPRKPGSCDGCPNYSNCRAHLGCANNSGNR